MGREAVWVPLPDEPHSLVGWTLLALVEEGPRVLGSTLCALLVASLVALSVVLGFPTFDLNFAGWSFPSRRRRARPSLAALAPSPCQDRWFPVYVEVRKEGVRTGFDQGMATFWDGWLLMEGRRTAFSVRGCDAALAEHGEGFRLWMPGSTVVEIAPYDRLGPNERLAEDFGLKVRQWMRSPTPEGLPTYPPHTVHPWAWGRAWSSVMHGAGLVLLGVVGGMVWPVWYGWAGATVAALCGLWRLGRGTVDLRRLSRIVQARIS